MWKRNLEYKRNKTSQNEIKIPVKTDIFSYQQGMVIT